LAGSFVAGTKQRGVVVGTPICPVAVSANQPIAALFLSIAET
jgi:hypothetical protein